MMLIDDEQAVANRNSNISKARELARSDTLVSVKLKSSWCKLLL